MWLILAILAAIVGANVGSLKDHLIAVTGRDLRAAFSDVFGYKYLSPDQERHIEALQTESRVSAMGAMGCGKTFDEGIAAAMLVATSCPCKALFGAGKFEQALELTWLEMSRAVNRANDLMAKLPPRPDGRQVSFCRAPGVSDWYPVGRDRQPDWYARCMAMSQRDNAASVGGMMHSERVLVSLNEIHAVAPEIWKVLDAGTNQEQVSFWTSFNPLDPNSPAAVYHMMTPEAGRCEFSAIRAAEWQAEKGISIPGMPTLASIKAKWSGRENDPMYYASVLGKYPPQSADNVVLPQNWFDDCVGVLQADDKATAYGLDTAGGGAENVLACVRGRAVSIELCDRQHHETPQLVTRVKDVMSRLGRAPIAIDYVGLGGKGVGDDLTAEGYEVLPFVGGGQTFADKREQSGLYADLATWAWFSLREAVRLTRQGPERFISLPNDPTLREQFARGFGVTAERRYKLQPKDELRVSPDRADAVAMAWLAAYRPASYIGMPVAL